MPNGESQEYVIKAPSATYRIRAPKGMEQAKVLSLAAATNTKFAEEYPRVQAYLKTHSTTPVSLQEKEFPITHGGSYTSMSPTGIATSPQIPARTQAEVIGAGLGGSELAGAAKGLPWALRVLAGSSGAGAGAGTGAAVTGASPKEALGTAAVTTATALPFEALGQSQFLKWLTSSKSRGAKLLQMAETKAGHLPVELSPKTNEIVEQIVEHGNINKKTPGFISYLLERLGPTERASASAKPGPLTYREARLVQGSASELSVEEQAAYKGRMKGLIKQFAKSFSEDVQKTADAGGVGKQHAAGMKEYAMASSRNRTLVKAAKATAAGATTVGGYELLKQLLKQGHP